MKVMEDDGGFIASDPPQRVTESFQGQDETAHKRQCSTVTFTARALHHMS